MIRVCLWITQRYFIKYTKNYKVELKLIRFLIAVSKNIFICSRCITTGVLLNTELLRINSLAKVRDNQAKCNLLHSYSCKTSCKSQNNGPKLSQKINSYELKIIYLKFMKRSWENQIFPTIKYLLTLTKLMKTLFERSWQLLII